MVEDRDVEDMQPLLATRGDGVLRVTLNRPERANALNDAMVDSFLKVFEQESLVAGIRALVVTGAGPNFCGGFDLSNITALSEGDIVLRFLRIESLLQQLYHAPYITIACAQGNAVGAGADIFAACNYRIAAPGARFRMPGWRFGIALGTRRLSDRIGAQLAREMLATIRTLTADAALELSLVTHVVESESWPSFVDKIARDSDTITNDALAVLHDSIVPDHREADMAGLVASALRPAGLKNRLLAYIQQHARASKVPT